MKTSAFADMRVESLKTEKGAMHVASPLGKFCLAAETEALEELLVALVSGQLEVVKQLATTCDHLEKATTCGMIFLMRSEVLRKSVDSLRQESHLDVGAAGVFFVDLEGGGIDGGCFAHGSFEWPDNLSGGVKFWDVGPRRNHRCSFWQERIWGKFDGEFTVVYSG